MCDDITSSQVFPQDKAMPRVNIAPMDVLLVIVLVMKVVFFDDTTQAV